MAFWGFPKRGKEIVYAYRTRMDEKVCDECAELEGTEYPIEIIGETEQIEEENRQLKWIFPYCERQDEDFVKVNLHPNCRCYLEKVSEE